jgi:hypothetical protein
MKNLLNTLLRKIYFKYKRVIDDPNKLGNILCMTLKIYGIKQEESPYDTKPLKVLKSEVSY